MAGSWSMRTPLIFFHFQGLRRGLRWFIFNSHRIFGAPFSPDIREHIYRPYVDELLAIEKITAPMLDVQESRPPGAIAYHQEQATKCRYPRVPTTGHRFQTRVSCVARHGILARNSSREIDKAMLPPFWDYRREYDELREEILAAVDRVFKSGQLILGPEGIAFERDMAAYVGVSGGVGVNSGTDAIYIALAAAGVAAGDEVITVPNTAVPTVAAIQILGARPVFVDIREDDFLMDVDQVEAAITPRTRAIVPVHLYGQCVDLDPLVALARRHGLRIVEDCAQSQGALYRNRRCGSIGTAATFSFYPTKRSAVTATAAWS